MGYTDLSGGSAGRHTVAPIFMKQTIAVAKQKIPCNMQLANVTSVCRAELEVSLDIMHAK